ncbi:MAG: HD domain-containing phosphohydrolase [Pyrinomonadaceae bacterium]
MSFETQKLIHTFAALADLGQEIAEKSDFQEMVRSSFHLLLGSLAIRRGALAEYEPTDGLLRFIANRGFGDELPAQLTLSEQEAGRLVGSFSRAASVNERRANFPVEDKELLDQLGVELSIPLVMRGDLIGLVVLGGKANGEAFSDEDRELLDSMARHIGVGIKTHRLMEELEHKAEENRRLYDGLREIYKDTVRAFAAAIDIKDKYTQGHSERVGRYSEIIARELGWSEDRVEGIAIAGYLHDIGKLIVERDIINAPYRINAKESKELNQHPAAGFEILEPIHHPYADIPLMARHHHERIDGRGYPDGLKGDEISLGARIVTLADSFDAMTTDRPYRKRRTLEEVVVDLRANTGKQFAPEVVCALCRAILKEVKGETSERRFTKMLGKGYIDPERVAPLIAELISELESEPSAVAGGPAR